MNGNTYPSASDNSRFTLTSKSYYYEYNNTNTVTAFAELPDGISNHTGTGKVAVTVDGILSKVMEFDSYTVSGNQITFVTDDSLGLDKWPTTGSANRLFPVVNANSAQSSILGTNLILSNSNNDLSLLPPEKGTFRVFDEEKYLKYNDLLQYEKLNGTTLEGVSRIHGTTTQIDIAATDYIVFQRFIDLDAVGSVGDGTSNLFSSRNISYHVPIEAFSGGATGPGDDLGQGKEDIFNSADDPKLVNDPKFAVLPGLKSFEAVVQATGTNVNDPDNGLINDGAVSFKYPNGIFDVHVNINWWRFADLGLGLNFDQAYEIQGNTLSYSAQMKARVWKQITDAMTGIQFRMNNNKIGKIGNSYYGVSLFYSMPDGAYPKWLGAPNVDSTTGVILPPGSPGGPNYRLANLPKGTMDNPNVYVVLWKRIGDDALNSAAVDTTYNITLLNYALLDAATVNPYSNALYTIDWASLVVKLEESVQSGSKTNDFKIKVFSKNENLIGTFNWPSLSEWNTTTLSEPDEDSFTTSGLTSIPRVAQEDDGSYDTGCESCLDCATTCGRPEIGVHVFADVNPDQKLYIDDFAIRLLGGGDAPGGSVGFQQ